MRRLALTGNAWEGEDFLKPQRENPGPFEEKKALLHFPHLLARPVATPTPASPAFAQGFVASGVRTVHSLFLPNDDKERIKVWDKKM